MQIDPLSDAADRRPRAVMGYSFISKRSIWTSSFCRCERPRDRLYSLGFRLSLSLSLPCTSGRGMVE
jgi:hypothetical protein